jgi:hypothetical protein
VNGNRGSTVVKAEWWRHCATNRKVAVSIPDGVTVICHWHNPSDRTLALGSTQPLTEMSTMSLRGGKAVGAKGWQPYHHPVPLSWNLGTLTSWNPLEHSRPVTGLLYLFTQELVFCPLPAFQKLLSTCQVSVFSQFKTKEQVILSSLTLIGKPTLQMEQHTHT